MFSVLSPVTLRGMNGGRGDVSHESGYLSSAFKWNSFLSIGKQEVLRDKRSLVLPSLFYSPLTILSQFAVTGDDITAICKF